MEKLDLVLGIEREEKTKGGGKEKERGKCFFI